MVNAGPTREQIDPVRYITNNSTGLMGVEIADAASSEGADVVLILGPSEYRPSQANIRVVDVVSAADMERECVKHFPECDAAVLSAAVADYTPGTVSDKKIKRKGKDFVLKLKPTADIAALLGSMKRRDQLLVGFALETDNEIENALNKLKRKNLDLIVLNSMRDKGAGFGYKTNVITIIDKSNNIDKFELKLKSEAAMDIIKKVASEIKKICP